jgi:hypothetical protein
MSSSQHLLFQFQHSHECFLWNIDSSNSFHPLLSFSLFANMTILRKILRRLAITKAYAINAPEIIFHKIYKK